MSVRLGRFIERCGVLPTTQFAYRKCLGTCDALLCMSHTLQRLGGSEARIEARIVHEARMQEAQSLPLTTEFLTAHNHFLPHSLPPTIELHKCSHTHFLLQSLAPTLTSSHNRISSLLHYHFLLQSIAPNQFPPNLFPPTITSSHNHFLPQSIIAPNQFPPTTTSSHNRISSLLPHSFPPTTLAPTLTSSHNRISSLLHYHFLPQSLAPYQLLHNRITSLLPHSFPLTITFLPQSRPPTITSSHNQLLPINFVPQPLPPTITSSYNRIPHCSQSFSSHNHLDRKSTRLNSSHSAKSRMPSSA